VLKGVRSPESGEYKAESDHELANIPCDAPP
jgi:hypothetical protein